MVKKEEVPRLVIRWKLVRGEEGNEEVLNEGEKGCKDVEEAIAYVKLVMEESKKHPGAQIKVS